MNIYRLFRKDQWVKSTRNVQMDDLDYVLRNRWPMGRVTEVFCGEDGGVRSVKINTASSMFYRPVTKICLLEEAS